MRKLPQLVFCSLSKFFKLTPKMFITNFILIEDIILLEASPGVSGIMSEF
jgi:hypothetical protein